MKQIITLALINMASAVRLMREHNLSGTSLEAATGLIEQIDAAECGDCLPVDEPLLEAVEIVSTEAVEQFDEALEECGDCIEEVVEEVTGECGDCLPVDEARPSPEDGFRMMDTNGDEVIDIDEWMSFAPPQGEG